MKIIFAALNTLSEKIISSLLRKSWAWKDLWKSTYFPLVWKSGDIKSHPQRIILLDASNSFLFLIHLRLFCRIRRQNLRSCNCFLQLSYFHCTLLAIADKTLINPVHRHTYVNALRKTIYWVRSSVQTQSPEYVTDRIMNSE